MSKSLVIASLCLLAFANPAGAGLLRTVEYSESSNYSRVEIHFDALPQFDLLLLENPNRAVIDFSPGKAHSSIANQTLDSPAIRRIRFGQQRNGDLRVVFDLRSKTKPLLRPITNAKGKLATLVVDFPFNRSACDIEPHKDVVIVVDAGHGGRDTGAIAVNGYYEKDIVLAIAKFFKADLERHPGFKVLLSRHNDHYIELEDRHRFAGRERAHLFLSIHADSFKTSRPVGASVFNLSQRRAEAELERWERENKHRSVWQGGGVADWINSACISDPSELLFLNHKHQEEALAESVRAGKSLLHSLAEVVSIHPRSINSKTGDYQIKQAGFVVLKATSVPSLLVETGFLSNPTEAKRLASSSHQRQIAAAISRGVRAHFCAHPPWNTDLQTGVKTCQPVSLRYVVRRGDTLNRIAALHDIPLTFLKRENGLRDDKIFVGEVLSIPKP